MTILRLLRAALLAAASIAAGASLAQGLPMVFGEPAKAENAAPEARLHNDAKVAGQRLKLAPVTNIEIGKLLAENARGRAGTHVNLKRVAIGIERELEAQAAAPDSGALDWTPVDGGRAARLSVTSPDAPAVRVALNLLDVPSDIEMVFFGSQSPEKLFGPYRVGDVADRTAAWWSPLTPGETLTVEFFEPRRAREAGSDPRVANVAHLFTNPATDVVSKRLQDIGDAGSCNVDIACSPLRTSTAFQNVVESVAQMVFNDTQFTYLCTGTLLNDTDASTQKPWFFSANHCFDDGSTRKTATQMQTIA